VPAAVPLPIVYEGVQLDAGYRIDMLVENAIIIEVKAVDALTRVHDAQILTYLRLSGCRLGFLMNFNVELFKHGLKRVVLSS
jgi:GxxExxY protein